MINDLKVEPKGEQRDGEEVYTITLSRGANSRNLDFTRKEVKALIHRERLRRRRLKIILQEAIEDGEDTAVQITRLSGSVRKISEMVSMLEYMD